MPLQLWPDVMTPHRPTGANTEYRQTVVPSATEDPELELRARFVAGDADVLKDIYAEHGAAVYTFAKRALGADLASDLTQEVFLSAWRARSSFDSTKGSLGRVAHGNHKEPLDRLIPKVWSSRRPGRTKRAGSATRREPRSQSVWPIG